MSSNKKKGMRVLSHYDFTGPDAENKVESFLPGDSINYNIQGRVFIDFIYSKDGRQIDIYWAGNGNDLWEKLMRLVNSLKRDAFLHGIRVVGHAPSGNNTIVKEFTPGDSILYVTGDDWKIGLILSEDGEQLDIYWVASIVMDKFRQPSFTRSIYHSEYLDKLGDFIKFMVTGKETKVDDFTLKIFHVGHVDIDGPERVQIGNSMKFTLRGASMNNDVEFEITVMDRDHISIDTAIVVKEPNTEVIGHG